LCRPDPRCFSASTDHPPAASSPGYLPVDLFPELLLWQRLRQRPEAPCALLWTVSAHHGSLAQGTAVNGAVGSSLRRVGNRSGAVDAADARFHRATVGSAVPAVPRKHARGHHAQPVAGPADNQRAIGGPLAPL